MRAEKIRYLVYEEEEEIKNSKLEFGLLVFDSGIQYTADEGFSVRDGRIYASSYANGVLSWEGNQYILMYHHHQSKLGTKVELWIAQDEPKTL